MDNTKDDSMPLLSFPFCVCSMAAYRHAVVMYFNVGPYAAHGIVCVVRNSALERGPAFPCLFKCYLYKV